MPLLNLPNEILLQILGCITKGADINSLIQTNRHLYTLGKPYLYRQNATHHNSMALDWGAQKNRLDTMRSALEHGADVEATFDGPVKPTGLRALHRAADIGAKDAIKLLLDHGADPNVPSAFGTALLLACRRGHLGAVEALLESPDIDPNAVGNSRVKDTPLCCAVDGGHFEIVERLLACERVDVNQPSLDRGMTPLYISVIMRDHEVGQRMTGLLLAHPDIDPNLANGDGWPTPLMEAAMAGDIVRFRSLLEHPRLDLSARDDQGKPVLSYAVLSRNTELVQLMLDRGANLNEEYRDGSSALADAARYSRASMVPFLLARGADPRIGLPLHAAVWLDIGAVQPLLADPRTEVNARDRQGRTALSHAAENHRDGAVEALLRHPNIDVDIKDGDGMTAANIAEREGWHDIVDLLRAFESRT
ncbi:uncharacterized protein DSM5745_05058 [Aspergillus mulundensis]|uniref:Uncharacterized protein n=1 Tax=Aspergillus mulundensis TaxID=1810919 RepID=A0A3D8S609_9EURO|nr:hypothetical protein DSM5745_05058 [Aspergillus mulundensis]RDW81501.1 hypothetical protein DSM5745_05058 [Aspergillus mulundensis]